MSNTGTVSDSESSGDSSVEVDNDSIHSQDQDDEVFEAAEDDGTMPSLGGPFSNSTPARQEAAVTEARPVVSYVVGPSGTPDVSWDAPAARGGRDIQGNGEPLLRGVTGSVLHPGHREVYPGSPISLYTRSMVEDSPLDDYERRRRAALAAAALYARILANDDRPPVVGSPHVHVESALKRVKFDRPNVVKGAKNVLLAKDGTNFLRSKEGTNIPKVRDGTHTKQSDSRLSSSDPSRDRKMKETVNAEEQDNVVQEKKQLTKLGKYNGISVPLETFLARYEKHSKFYNWSEKSRLFFLEDSLDGLAGNVLWDCKEQGTSEDLKQLLRNRFDCEDQDEQYLI